MPSTSRLTSAALCVVLAGLLGGCSDYLKRRDTITATAGHALNWNKVVHIADPWPPYVANTDITGDGQRVSGVIERYSTGAPAPSSGTPSASGSSAGAAAAPAQ